MDAVVSTLEGDLAVLDVKPMTGCGRCLEPGGCGGGLSIGSTCVRQYRVVNGIGAKPGDRVVVRIADGVILRAAWQAYGVPGLLAILGAALGYGLAGGEGAAVIGAACGLAVGIVALRRRRREWDTAQGGLTLCFPNQALCNDEEKTCD
jgi:sigma-E factor negative regulatory protein RseC